MALRKLAALGILLSRSAGAFARTEGEKEPIGVIELGVAPNWSVNGSGHTLSPTSAFEFTPIEKWLEIEIGVTPTFAHHSTEWDTDFLFKKPWTLTRKLELMAGVGPSWIHTRASGKVTNSLGGKAILDFMFWPTAKTAVRLVLRTGIAKTRGRAKEIRVRRFPPVAEPHR